jgi:DNA-binding GntR family transcriptional regulator
MIRIQPASNPQLAAQTEAAQDVVYRWLKQHVLTLPRHEGVFLTEAAVCQATGTSRTPVREAMLRVESDGLLQIVPKKGAFVPPITEADIEAVMQARGLVEDWCVQQAARSGDLLFPELERLLDQQKQLQQLPVAFIECDREFHRAIVRAAGNPILGSFYESLRDRQLRMGLQAIAASEQRTRAVLGEHTAIVDAVRSGNPKGAAAAMAAHLFNTLVTLQRPNVGWGRGATEPDGSRRQE